MAREGARLGALLCKDIKPIRMYPGIPVRCCDDTAQGV